jgi:hypothetical protein
VQRKNPEEPEVLYEGWVLFFNFLRTGFIFQTMALIFQYCWPRIPYPLVLSLKKRKLHNTHKTQIQ